MKKPSIKLKPPQQRAARKSNSKADSTEGEKVEKKSKGSWKRKGKQGSGSCDKNGSNKGSKGSHSGKQRKPSGEKTSGADLEQQVEATKALCEYVMSKESLAAHFDKNLATYTNSTQTATTEWDKNMSKNRSKSHKMLDHSRVIVKEEPTIYLNASLVSFDEIETDFIVAQYPIAESVLDFWKMIRLEQIDRVITIFEPTVDESIEEFHKIADSSTRSPTPTSAVNSPASVVQQAIVGKSCRCEPIGTKSIFPLFADNYYNIDEWLINTKKVETEEKLGLSTYTVEVVQGGCSNGLLARVFNCSTWPWKSVPSEEAKLLALARNPWKNLAPTYEPGAKKAKQVRHKPVVVMCDLGLDRSATVVFTALLVQMIYAGKKIDCDALFRKFRDQRAGVFTNSMFFTAAIRAVLTHMRDKLKVKWASEVDNINSALLKIPAPQKK